MEEKWDACAFPVDERAAALTGECYCYGRLVVQLREHITAFVLSVFPATLRMIWRKALLHIPCRISTTTVRRKNMMVPEVHDHVPYDVWEKQGILMMMMMTDGGMW